MYDNGWGVSQDNVHAQMWFNIAASSAESKVTSQNKDIVAKRINPSQIETAQKLIRERARENYKGC